MPPVDDSVMEMITCEETKIMIIIAMLFVLASLLIACNKPSENPSSNDTAQGIKEFESLVHLARVGCNREQSSFSQRF